jgi:hypothetical protein
MIFEISQILKQLNHLAIFFFLLRATYFNELIYSLIGIIIGLIIFVFQIRKFFVYKDFFIYIILSFIVATVTFYNNGFSDGLIFFPMTLASIGIAWSIYENGLSHKFILLIFYFLFLYLITEVFFFSTDLDNIFSNSRNHISALFINLFSLIVISSHLNKVNLNYINCILLLIVCYLAVGASGIFISFFIFISFIFYKLLKFYTRFISLVLIFNLVIIILFILFWKYIQLQVELNFEETSDIYIKYTQDLVEIFIKNVRFEILMEYLSSLDFKKFILGGKLNQVIYGFSNYHNSFVVLHIRSGIFIFCFFIFFIYALIKNFYKDYMFFVCLLGIILKSSTDTTLFSGYHFDYIFTYLLFFSHKEKFKKMV